MTKDLVTVETTDKVDDTGPVAITTTKQDETANSDTTENNNNSSQVDKVQCDVANGDDSQLKDEGLISEGKDTNSVPVSVEESRGADTIHSTVKIEVDNKRMSSEVTEPPIMSPQSITSQDNNSVSFEERAL